MPSPAASQSKGGPRYHLVEAEVIDPAVLSPAQRDAVLRHLYDVHHLIFAGVSMEQFARAIFRSDAVVTPERHAFDAVRTMSDGGVRHLPVIKNGRIHGSVSRSDFTGVEIDRLDEDEHLAECIW